jgi:serine/threonine-protein kinase
MLIALRYELGETLGSGGFATVYRARDRVEEREVAVKVVPLGGDAVAHFERFRQEALALSRLRSRYLARVFDFGKDEAAGLYLVMELVEGVPLDAQALGRPLLPHQILRVARGVLGGLAVAHASGIVHRDVKPSNVLVPRGERMFEEPRVIDFGIAQSERRSALLEAIRGHDPSPLVGTPSFMAPEQLAGESVGPQADVYSAGLVLFDLLGVGPIFEGATLRDRLRARLAEDPSLEGRVPSPLGPLFAKMLARDPAKRFPTAREALEAVLDLDTAPVDVDELLGAPSSECAPVLSVNASLAPPHPLAAYVKRLTGSTAPPPPLAEPPRRLSRLPEEPVAALRETLVRLDLAMLDALARRERGSTFGRISRGMALALRLELDAAALILEPLAPQSDVARAIGQAVVAPRARRVTRARVDSDRDDRWISTIDPELGGLLCAFGVAMTTREDAGRNQTRCTKMIERLGAARSPQVTTLRMAERTAACLAGAGDAAQVLHELLRMRHSDAGAPAPFDVLMRALLLGALGFRADEHLARVELERAARVAAETGSTLLEARALVAWGGMLVEVPGRVEQGLEVLERATTLLAHGDVPSLEHIAEHNRGAALIIQGRWADAAPHFQRAREAAAGERSREHEVASAMNEASARVCLGDRAGAERLLEEMSDVRLAQVSHRTAGFALVARALAALAWRGLDAARAEANRALARAAEAGADAGDAYLMSELLLTILHAAKGDPVDLLARAGQMEKRAQEIGFLSFYWFDMLRAAIAQVTDPAERQKLEGARARLFVMLGPEGQMALSRRTSRPPSP